MLPYVGERAAGDRWRFDDEYESHDLSIRSYAPALFLCPTRRSAAEAVIPPGPSQVEFTLPCGCKALSPVPNLGGVAADYGGNHGDLSRLLLGEPDALFGGGTGVIITSLPGQGQDGPSAWLNKVALADITDGASKTTLAGEMFVPLHRLGAAPFDGEAYNGIDLLASARFGGPGGAPLGQTPNDPLLEADPMGFGSWHPGYCPFAWADGSVRRVEVDVDIDVYARMMHRYDGGPRRAAEASF